ncbi:MAG: hypothetical protein JWO89_3550 [Verrucomicrobiaceae bacterium]|nr:hypothetical protein [Verrucomicrobiaceae bacterium]
MQTGNRISSPDTFFLRRVFPVIWFGLLALGLIQVCFMKLKPHQSPTLLLVALLGMAVFSYFVMRVTLSGLVNEVYDFGDTLLVKNGGIAVQIPLRNVSHITFCSSSKPDRITLELAVPCELGKKIAFIPTPKGRLSSYGAAITDSLKHRIGSERAADRVKTTKDNGST